MKIRDTFSLASVSEGGPTSQRQIGFDEYTEMALALDLARYVADGARGNRRYARLLGDYAISVDSVRVGYAKFARRLAQHADGKVPQDKRDQKKASRSEGYLSVGDTSLLQAFVRVGTDVLIDPLSSKHASPVTGAAMALGNAIDAANAKLDGFWAHVLEHGIPDGPLAGIKEMRVDGGVVQVLAAGNILTANPWELTLGGYALRGAVPEQIRT